MKPFGKKWLRTANDEELREKRDKLNQGWFGSFRDDIQMGIDEAIDKIDSIDWELNRRAWDKYNSEDHSQDKPPRHREHGWYLPNDD